jgi:leucoanthocyanidin reductase
VASLTHDIFINGCQTNFAIDGHDELEISDLYPDADLRTVDECFDNYISDLNLNEGLKENLKESLKEEKVPASMVKPLPIPATCA